MLFVVYAEQNDEATAVFRCLKSILEEVGRQQIIVIECLPVELLEGEAMGE